MTLARALLVILMSSVPHVATAGQSATCAGLEPAVQQFNDGGRDAAYPRLRALADMDCGEPVVYLYAGVVERARGAFAQATATMRRGLRHAPAHTQLWLELATTYAWAERLPDALAAYRSALDIDPASLPARLGEARVLGWLGKRDLAMARFESVLEAAPTSVEALTGLAAVHLQALRPDQARIYYERALALEPSTQDAILGMRQANTLRRTEVAVGLSRASGTASRSRTAGVMVSYRATPELRLSGGYDAAARDPLREPLAEVPPDADGGFAPYGWRASADWRMNRRTAFGMSVQSRRIARDTITSVGLDASRSIGRRVTAFGGWQPGRSTLGGHWTLTSAGVSMATSKSTTAVVQGFRGTSARGGSTAMAATIVAQTWRGSSLRASIARGNERERTFTSVTGQAAWTVTAGTEIRVDGAWYRGPVRTTHIAVVLTSGF